MKCKVICLHSQPLHIWLVRAAQEGLAGQFLFAGGGTTACFEVNGGSALPGLLSNYYQPVSNYPFIGKEILDDYLDPFQSGSRLTFGTETTLDALMPMPETRWGDVSLLVLMNLSIAFDTIEHSVFLGQMVELIASLGGASAHT